MVLFIDSTTVIFQTLLTKTAGDIHHLLFF